REVAPLVHEKTCTMVSRPQGTAGVVAVAGRASPPQRSTSVSPRTVTHTDAPTSPRSAKLRSNSSRTWENRREQKPEIAMITPPISCPAVSIGLAVHRPGPEGRLELRSPRHRPPAPTAVDRTARAGANGPGAAGGTSEPDPGEHGRPRAGGL